MSLNNIILKLQAVRSSTTSEANKQLLTECMDELREMQRESEASVAPRAAPTYQTKDRVKLKEGIGVTLTPEGKRMRFLINTVDEKNNMAWVVDAEGKEKPCWLSLSSIEPAND